MEFVRLHTFEKTAAGLLSELEVLELEVELVAHPDAGDRIPGGRGLRKLRRPAKGRGKRGGVRIIYYYVTAENVFCSFWPMRRMSGKTWIQPNTAFSPTSSETNFHEENRFPELDPRYP